MAKDIEEFLRAAAARRREAQGAPPPAAPQRPAQQTTAPRQKKEQRSAPLLSDVDVEVVAERKESVAQHVAAHLDSSRLDASRLKQNVERLGAEISRADDVVESRLHKTFDHQVGTLTKFPGEVASVAPSDPGNRASHPMLSTLVTPHGIRQALIASEILKRPEWD